MKNLLVTICLLMALPLAAQWRPLFNGKDLTGWSVVGAKGKFEVKNGEIHGISVAGPGNTFLRTNEEFSDFIFEAQFKIDEGINSGVQFRSALSNSGTVYGYQMEIDHSPRAWSGGIYEEGRRGWLYPLEQHPAAQKLYNQKAWNTYRIEAIGSDIRTFINGQPVAHLVDNQLTKGFIALQVHSLYNLEDVGKINRWRNIRIQTQNLKPLAAKEIYTVNLLPNQLSASEKAAGWQLLWDGRSTAGWRSVFGTEFPQNGWQIQEDALVVVPTDGSETGNDIVTTEKYGPAFELRFEFWFDEGANSGVKYFVDEQYKSGGKSGIGLEFQILDDDRHPDAKEGVVGNRTIGSLYDLIPSKKMSWIAGKPRQWNLGRVVCYPDGKVEHWLNNAVVVTYQRGGQIYDALVARSKYAKYPGFGLAPSGYILLQDHGNHVKFRSLRIRKL